MRRVGRATAAALLGWMLALVAGTAGGAEELKATLERNPIHAGESVRLVLELRRASGGLKPDLTPLTADFQILHTSANTQIEFVQGLQSAITRWTIELTPKREGTLTIPSIAVSQFRSPELVLQVLPARQAGDGGRRDIFLEAEVSPDPAYVQAQMRFVVRLLRSVDVVDGTLTEPNATNAVIRRLGRDISYTTTRDGRSYRVLERRYGLFPQASGELVISPVEFEGEIVEPGEAGTGLSRLFARGKRIQLRTDVVRAVARPPPEDYPGATWLPAKSLELAEEWSADPAALRAGEPVTRTLTLRAVGLAAEQLPEIVVGATDRVKEYSDQPITRTTTDTDWVHGVREQRVALVPGNEGTITLPGIRIVWWDTERDALREAALPPRTLRVAAGAINGAGVAATAPTGRSAEEPAERPWWKDGALWQAIAALLAALWLATLFAWRRARSTPRGGPPARNKPQASRGPPTRLRDACLGNDAATARQALLDWAADQWPERPPGSLPALARRLDDPRLQAELSALDRALYARDRTPWQGEPLWQAARAGLRVPGKAARAQREDDLPVLYPRG